MEVTTTDVSENTVTHTILSLQCGKTDQVKLCPYSWNTNMCCGSNFFVSVFVFGLKIFEPV